MSKQKLRIIAILLVFAIVLTGCTQKAPVEPTPAPTPNPTVAPTPEQTPEPTPTPKPTKRPGGGGGGGGGSSGGGSTPTPTQTPAPVVTAPTISTKDGKIVWADVPNATSYLVSINGTEKATAVTSPYTVTDGGIATVKVKAKNANSQAVSNELWVAKDLTSVKDITADTLYVLNDINSTDNIALKSNQSNLYIKKGDPNAAIKTTKKFSIVAPSTHVENEVPISAANVELSVSKNTFKTTAKIEILADGTIILKSGTLELTDEIYCPKVIIQPDAGTEPVKLVLKNANNANPAVEVQNNATENVRPALVDVQTAKPVVVESQTTSDVRVNVTAVGANVETKATNSGTFKDVTINANGVNLQNSASVGQVAVSAGGTSATIVNNGAAALNVENNAEGTTTAGAVTATGSKPTTAKTRIEITGISVAAAGGKMTYTANTEVALKGTLGFNVYGETTTTALPTGITLVNKENTEISTITTGALDNKNVGFNKPITIDVKLSGEKAGDYILILPKLTIQVEKKELTVTGVDITTKAKSYDGTEHVVSDCTNTGMDIIEGDKVTLAYDGKYIKDSKAFIGEETVDHTVGISAIVAVSAAGVDGNNYYVVNVNGTPGNTATITGCSILATHFVITFNGNDGFMYLKKDIDQGNDNGTKTKTLKVKRDVPTKLPTTALNDINNPIIALLFGYDLVGWYTEKEGTGTKVADLYTPTANIELFAKWTEHEYEVKYNLDGGKNHANNPNTYKLSDKTVFLENPTKEGYHFVGWKIKFYYDDEESFDGVIDNLIDVHNFMTDKPYERTAIWSTTDQNALPNQTQVNFTVDETNGKVGVYRRINSEWGDRAKMVSDDYAKSVNVYTIPKPGYRVVIKEDDKKPMNLKLTKDERNDILNGFSKGIYAERFNGLEISFEEIPKNLPVISEINFYSDKELTAIVANKSSRPLYQKTYVKANTDFIKFKFKIDKSLAEVGKNEDYYSTISNDNFIGKTVGDIYTFKPEAIYGYSTVDPKFENKENRPYIVISAAEKVTLTFKTTEGTMSAGAGETYTFSADKKTATLSTFVGKSAKTPILTKPGYDVWWHDENGNSIGRLTESGRGYIHEVVGGATYTATFVEKLTPIPDFDIYLNNDNTAYVYKYTGSDANVTIPREYNGRPVVSIYSWAFKDNTTINSVIIPDSVKEIGSEAFNGCLNLKTVTMSANIEEVGSSAFTGTKAITTVDGVKYVGSVVVGYEIAQGATKLTIKEGARVFAYGAIAGESTIDGITAVTLPSTLYSIDNYSLPATIKTITIPEKNELTRVKDYYFIFNYSKDRQEDGIIYIGNVAVFFMPYSINPQTLIEFKNTTVAIEGCSIGNIADAQTSLVIPASVKFISSFQLNTIKPNNVTAITFAENSQLQEIGSSAIRGFNKVTTIELPKSLRNAHGAFMGMTSLESITVSQGNPYLKAIDGVLYSKDEKELLGYPSNRVGDTYTISQNATSVKSLAFSKVQRLQELTFPSKIEKIDGEGVSSSSIKKFIVLPTNKRYEAIVDGTILKDKLRKETIAFAGGSVSISDNIVIPEGIESIDSRTFNYSKIQSVELPRSLKSIGFKAFEDCANLTKVTFAENGNLETINDFAFSRTSLNSLDLPNTLKEIENNAFSNLGDKSKLTGVIIPSSVTTIGNNAFDQSQSGKKLTIYVPWAENNKPAGWDANWAGGGNTIVYGFTNTAFETTFNANGVGITAPAKVVGVIANAPNVSLAGNRITWHTDSSCSSSAVTFPYAPAASGTLYAKATTNTP